MRDLTREDIEAQREDPEQARLKMSPQILLALMDGHFVASDGHKARITRVYQWDDGTIDAAFERFE